MVVRRLLSDEYLARGLGRNRLNAAAKRPSQPQIDLFRVEPIDASDRLKGTQPFAAIQKRVS